MGAKVRLIKPPRCRCGELATHDLFLTPPYPRLWYGEYCKACAWKEAKRLWGKEDKALRPLWKGSYKRGRGSAKPLRWSRDLVALL